MRPKDLGTLDGSCGGLILPRRVKATPLSVHRHAELVCLTGCQEGSAVGPADLPPSRSLRSTLVAQIAFATATTVSSHRPGRQSPVSQSTPVAADTRKLERANHGLPRAPGSLISAESRPIVSLR